MPETLFCGRYRVVRRLGSGGTATVFLAEDERLARSVAVKRLHGAEVTDETAERLRREARLMASLRHPNLVTVLDMLTEDEDLFLMMEYVDGGTLRDVLEDAPLEPQRVLDLLRPVAAALDHAHAHGIVHRDVKPTNVLVSSAGDVKLGDLGLATAAEITRITPPGSILGTPAYMAPEQAQPVPCTPATDIYGLATIAFEALSGTLPRTGVTAMAVLRQAATMPPADLRDRRPGTPEAAAQALMRGMALEPDERQQTATALLDELEAGLRGDAAPPPDSHHAAPVDATRRMPAQRRRRRTPADVLAADRAPAPPPSGPSRRMLAVLALAATLAAAAAIFVLARDSGGAGESRETATGEPTREPTSDTAGESVSQPGGGGDAEGGASAGTGGDAAAGSDGDASAGAGGGSSGVGEEPGAETQEGAGTPTTGQPATEATPRPRSATATVRAFYERAAGDEFAGAWRLAGPGMRAVYGGSRAEFQRQLSSLERIEFEELAVESRSSGTAIVRVRTIATHSNRVDRCSGTLQTVTVRGTRRVEPHGLSCQTG